MPRSKLSDKTVSASAAAPAPHPGDSTPTPLQASIPLQIPGYEVLGKLGRGGTAIVLKARQVSLDREVALKILSRKSSANRAFVEMFRREGKAVARLNHPNIVQAFDVGVDLGGRHFLVMEFVEGATVQDEINRRGAYPEAEAVRLAGQVAAGLAHAHEHGFVHRDVKPRNILVTGKRVAKLTDLGLARHTEDHELADIEEGKAFGTPYYIAPEQAMGRKDIDFRADIYSLGATLYHMLVGREPFDGLNQEEVFRKHLREPLVPPDRLRPGLSAGVSAVVVKMMAKNRDDRYRSTADLLTDLDRVAAGAPPLFADCVESAAAGEAPVELDEDWQARWEAEVTRRKRLRRWFWFVAGLLGLGNLAQWLTR